MDDNKQSERDRYIECLRNAFPDGVIPVPLFHRGKVQKVSIESDGSTKTTMEDMSPSSLLRWKEMMDASGVNPNEYM